MRLTHMSHADLVLRCRGRALTLGRVEAGERCNLELIDDLLKLQVALRRFGWSLHVSAVPPELEEIVDLVGLDRELQG